MRCDVKLLESCKYIYDAIPVKSLSGEAWSKMYVAMGLQVTLCHWCTLLWFFFERWGVGGVGGGWREVCVKPPMCIPSLAPSDFCPARGQNPSQKTKPH